MNKPFPGRGLVRTAVLVPWAIPTVVSSRIWQWMYNDQFGVINDILLKLQIINQSNAWLGNPNTAMWSIIITDTWKTIPFMALLLLAGLQTIPPELYEAAAIDGASSWQRFWHLTLPLLKPAILVSLIFRTLDAFRVYDVVFVMTHGASGTETLAVLNQRVLFSFLDFGYGSAISVIIFLIIFIFSIIYIKMLGLKLETS
jgi:ABC-type sugar transport system permease subunit